MEPFKITLFSTEDSTCTAPANPKKIQKQQKQMQKQEQKKKLQEEKSQDGTPKPTPQKLQKPHTIKRLPFNVNYMTKNERIERAEEKAEQAKLKAANKNNNNNNNNNSNKINKGGMSYSRPPVDATEILPFLYLGSALNAEDEELARKLRLSCVLNVAEELLKQVAEAAKKTQAQTQNSTNATATQEIATQKTQDATDAIAQDAEITCAQEITERISIVVHDAMPDTSNQYEIFEKAFLVIDKAKESGRPVLVHCMRGRSRSATIVIGYLMTRNKWTLKEAYNHVKKLRPFIGPHYRLKRQLIKFELHLYGKNSAIAGWM